MCVRKAILLNLENAVRSTDYYLFYILVQVSKFATYSTGNPDSFQLSHVFFYYPQFVFHLRRSQFLQVFNSSPDETAFYRVLLLRDNVSNALTMIQPTLVAYTLGKDGEELWGLW